MRDGELFFSGTFDFRGVTPGQTRAATGIVAPSGADASDPGYHFSLVYRDGRRQTVQPFIAADAFLPSLRALGLEVAVNRNTGVINVGGRRYRPGYFVEVAGDASLAFWTANQDVFGLAYRAVHANDDGIVDIEIISEIGVQVVYGLGQ